MELQPEYVKRFAPAAEAVDCLLEKEKSGDSPLFVGIDGRCGSGKTTLGFYLQSRFGGNLFHMDDFYLRVEQRTPERLAEIGGNVDYERFSETVLHSLLQKKAVRYQPFSCREWRLLDERLIPYRRLNIIEGSYSLHPYFGNPYQVRVFLDISPEKQMKNIRKRDGAQKAKQFEKLWIPKEEAYFAKFHVQDGAVRIFW